MSERWCARFADCDEVGIVPAMMRCDAMRCDARGQARC